MKELSDFLLHLLSQTIKNQISSDVSLQFFKDIKGLNILNSTMFIELIWIMGFIFISLKKISQKFFKKGLELDKIEKNDRNLKDYKKNFNKLINYLESNNIIENELLLERLDENQLNDASLIDFAQFSRRMKRINTKIKSKFFFSSKFLKKSLNFFKFCPTKIQPFP